MKKSKQDERDARDEQDKKTGNPIYILSIL
jgi:hypothetical protein